MRKSTKLVGLLAGTAGLVGGLAIAPQAQAATSVFSCAGIHGTNPVISTDTAPLNNETVPNDLTQWGTVANATLGGGAQFFDAVTGLQVALTNSPQSIKIKTKGDKVDKRPVGGIGLSRTVNDGATTAASINVSSATANFAAGDVGGHVVGTGIPAGVTIKKVLNATTVQISLAATASGSGLTLRIDYPNPGMAFTAGTCTSGSLGVSNLKAFAGSLAGKVSCNTASTYPNSVSPTGTQTLTFETGLDPVTNTAMKSTIASAITRPSSVTQLDGVKSHGIVTKGVVPGADASSVILQQPVYKDTTTPTGTTPWWNDNASATPGHAIGLTPTVKSLFVGANCQSPGGNAGYPNSIRYVAFGGDGNSLGGGQLHQSLDVTTET